MNKCFQRGLPPNWAMSLGIPGEITKFLLKARAESCYKIKFLDSEEHDVVFEVEEGNVVLDNFDIINAEGINGIYKLEIKALNGYVTILDKLDEIEIYKRIKEHYENILRNCLGKSVKEQMVYLGMDLEKSNLGSDYVENSKNFIMTLPSKPNEEQCKKLIDQILSGKGNDSLEYGYHPRDKFSVEMHQYARALAKKIGYKLPY